MLPNHSMLYIWPLRPTMLHMRSLRPTRAEMMLGPATMLQNPAAVDLGTSIDSGATIPQAHPAESCSIIEMTRTTSESSTPHHALY
jgi:hypothetical protein